MSQRKHSIQYGRIRTFLQEVLPVFCSDTYDIYMNILLDSLLIRFKSQKKILILCSVSLNMIVVLFQRYKFLISGQRQYMEKPKRTGGGGRTGEARKDEVSLLPLGLHYPYRYSIVTTRTFPIGIRFTSRTKISYYTIIV